MFGNSKINPTLAANPQTPTCAPFTLVPTAELPPNPPPQTAPVNNIPNPPAAPLCALAPCIKNSRTCFTSEHLINCQYCCYGFGGGN